MSYQLSKGLFLENGPAIKAAEARARRAKAEAYYLAEASKLAAARTVTGAELKIAA
ncbi:MAG TPA: hypothetical protein VJ763_06075 [Sphingomicrobium sp.]|jgi:hypothetical protein|nr:hypothetical protein [Sphingomicrobium sp.]